MAGGSPEFQHSGPKNHDTTSVPLADQLRERETSGGVSTWRDGIGSYMRTTYPADAGTVNVDVNKDTGAMSFVLRADSGETHTLVNNEFIMHFGPGGKVTRIGLPPTAEVQFDPASQSIQYSRDGSDYTLNILTGEVNLSAPDSGDIDSTSEP